MRRECLLQIRVQFSGIDFIFRHRVPAQILLAPLVGTIGHDRLADAVKTQHGRLDFAELDPVSPDLHLIVDPPDEVHVAVFHPASQIARAVQALPGSERAVRKLLFRQFRTVHVPPGDARPADAQLA